MSVSSKSNMASYKAARAEFRWDPPERYNFVRDVIDKWSADPDTAYRYAKGLPVVHPNHRGRVQITTPLDFLAVSDHAEFLGIVPALFAEDPRVGQTPTTDTFLEAAQTGDLWTAFTILTQQGGLAELDPGMDSPEINRSRHASKRGTNVLDNRPFERFTFETAEDAVTARLLQPYGIT